MITARAIAFCRIVKARTNEWEIYVKGTRENIMIRIAHSLSFEMANEAKEQINKIIASLEGRQYDPALPQHQPPTSNPQLSVPSTPTFPTFPDSAE